MTNRYRLDDLDPEYRQCTGKVYHRTRAKARKWIRREYLGLGRSKMYIYNCPVCAGYHLTARRPRELGARAR